MQENKYKSHHILVSHPSPSQVLPSHLNINAIKWDNVNDFCGILVKLCKPVIVKPVIGREYLPPEFSGIGKNAKLQLLNS